MLISDGSADVCASDLSASLLARRQKPRSTNARRTFSFPRVRELLLSRVSEGPVNSRARAWKPSRLCIAARRGLWAAPMIEGDFQLGANPARRRIVVAMSGGVDSSVVAALAHARGAETIGVTLQLYDHGEEGGRSEEHPSELT